MTVHDDLYIPIIPVNYLDVGTCFYCGCESELTDHIPPIRYIDFHLETNTVDNYSLVPCCKECLNFLHDCDQETLSERKIHINQCIGTKYLKALTIFKRWDESELADLATSFAVSIKAGIMLGKEAQNRMRYSGFEYEINGSIVYVNDREDELFDVFGETFENYNHALKYASKAYKINIVMLEKWLKGTEYDFSLAIDLYFADQERQLAENKKVKLCREFARKHGQNSKAIRSMLESYLEIYPENTIEYCLTLMLAERITGMNKL
jgi:hypothetical protein|tara:strand:+ start:65 stop:859 length:795 start_codon:yes stop_codon:yes gene_type:complete